MLYDPPSRLYCAESWPPGGQVHSRDRAKETGSSKDNADCEMFKQ